MGIRVGSVVPVIALVFLSGGSVFGQEIGAARGAAARSLDERIEALPGRPTTLHELVTAALDRNITLEIARMNRQVAEAEVDVAGGLFDPAFFLGSAFTSDPLVSGLRTRRYTAGLSKTFGLGTRVDLASVRSDGDGASLGSQASPDTDLSLSFSQPLLDGFNVRDTGFRIARVARAAARHRMERALEVLVADVEDFYWTLAEAEAVEAVLTKSLENSELLLFRNQELFARELVTEMDVITARSGRALRAANLVEARRARRDAAEALVFLVHGAMAASELAADSLPPKTARGPLEMLELPPLEDAEAEALVARSDIEAARQDVRGAEIAVDAAKNALRPSLSFDGLLGTTSRAGTLGSVSDDLTSEFTWSFGLNLSAPLGNRTDRGLDRAADWTHRILWLVLADSENRVRLDVRRALRGVRSGRERLDLADQAAALSLAQLDAERARLDLGLGDSFRLLETDENAVQAELVAVRSHYDLARALTAYRLAVGTVVEPYR